MDARTDYQVRADEEAERRRIRLMGTLASIERNIAPLRYEIPNQGDAPREMEKMIITPDGEQVGHLSIRNLHRGYGKDETFRLSSRRIPYRRGRSTYRAGGAGGTYREYKKVDSVIAAIKKFCFEESGDEKRAMVLRKEIREYEVHLNESRSRSEGLFRERETTFGKDYEYHTPRMLHVIEGLANESVEVQEQVDTLMKKYRVHKRFASFVRNVLIAPLQSELDSLDTSKEKIK